MRRHQRPSRVSLSVCLSLCLSVCLCAQRGRERDSETERGRQREGDRESVRRPFADGWPTLERVRARGEVYSLKCAHEQRGERENGDGSGDGNAAGARGGGLPRGVRFVEFEPVPGVPWTRNLSHGRLRVRKRVHGASRGSVPHPHTTHTHTHLFPFKPKPRF